MDTSEAERPEIEEPATDAAESEAPAAESEAPAAEVAEAAEPEAQEAEASEAEATETESLALEASETKDAEMATTEDPQTEAAKGELLEPAKENKGLSILKKVLLWAAIVISAVFLLLGLAGIIGAWAINTPATDTILAILEPIDNSLQRLETVAGEAGVALSEVSMSLSEADQQVQELGAGLAETNLVAEALVLIFDVDIGQKVEKAGQGVKSLYDTVVAVEETINAINSIPLLNIEVPGSAEMANIRTGMEELAVGVDELREQNQQNREERAENLVEALSAPLNRLNDRVDELHTRITGAEERLGLAVEDIDQIQGHVPGWIDLASIVATLLLAWMMFSQGAVIVLCWRALHKEPTSQS